MIVILGLIYGVFAAECGRKFTDHALLRRTGNRMLAHILEFRLFEDEPQAVFKAQKNLLIENMRLLRLVALPILLTSAAFLLLYNPLDRYLGRTALPEKTRFVISTRIGTTPQPPAGAVIETLVRIPRTRTASWRLRVTNRENALGHRHWLTWFLAFAAVGAGGQTAFRIARDAPNNVNP